MTELVAEVTNAMVKVQMETAEKCRDMFDIIIDKDIKIEELESKMDELLNQVQM